jgi:hypothetical protein
MDALLVLNVGGRSLHPRSRASFQAAAKRWGVEFVERTKPLAPVHHFWQKAFAIEEMLDFDRVLQLDADMLIRWDAPSPFRLVPDDHIGVVSSRQFTPPPRDFLVTPPSNTEYKGLWISRHRDMCIQGWARHMKMKPCHDEKHLNGGFFLYSTKIHRPLFKQLREVGESAKWTPWRLPEQASLSVLLHNLDVQQTWLPHTWNIVAAHQRHIREEYCTGYMNGYIYHFTGKVKRGERIKKTMWEKAPCDEIAQRLGERDVWAEVGVADGYCSLGVFTRRPNTRAFLVDQWGAANERYKKSGDLAARLTSDQWERVFERASRLTEKYDRKVLRNTSVGASTKIADRHFDMAYIDAEHTKEAVIEDLTCWLPKVKDGGWIGGHDYNHPFEAKRKLWGVKQVVDEVFPGEPLETGVCGTWFVRATPDVKARASKALARLAGK